MTFDQEDQHGESPLGLYLKLRRRRGHHLAAALRDAPWNALSACVACCARSASSWSRAVTSSCSRRSTTARSPISASRVTRFRCWSAASSGSGAPGPDPAPRIEDASARANADGARTHRHIANRHRTQETIMSNDLVRPGRATMRSRAEAASPTRDRRRRRIDQPARALPAVRRHRGPRRHRRGMAMSMHMTVAARVRRWLDERRARRELLILSDVALKDLAMDRSEIASVVRHGQSDGTRRRTKW